MFKVQRPIPGCDAKVGELVDAENWPNVDALVDQRYLRPALADAKPADHEAALLQRLSDLEARVASLESGLGVKAPKATAKEAAKAGASGNA